MTHGGRTPARTRLSAPAWLIVFALLLYAWTHRHAFQMIGFAEDLGLVQSLVVAAGTGDLSREVLPRWMGPLWGPGSTMWRPWAFTSLALDAKLYGAASGWWHVTNLLLHVTASAFTALLARAWLRSPWAAVAAFTTMLLHPWSSESTLWLVGRFDGWVTAAIAAALYFSWRSRGVDRWWFAAVFASSIAYLSKESALILLPATFMLVACRAQAESQSITRLTMASLAKALAPHLGAQLLIAGAYFALRWIAVGAVSTNVYGSNAVTGLGDLTTRVGQHMKSFAALSAASPVAASIAATLAAVATLGAIRARRWRTSFFSAGFVVTVFVGVALHFQPAAALGDGFRLYSLAIYGVAMLVASGVIAIDPPNSRPSFAVGSLVTWCLALAQWQNAVNTQWWTVGKEIRATAEAIGRELPRLSQSEYALIMLADSVGAVPAFRNAQGAIVRAAPARSVSLDNADHMIALLPTQIDDWYGLVQTDVVRRVTKRADAPPRPTRYYCKELGVAELRYLGFWEAGTLDEWRGHWRTAIRTACPSLKL